LSSRKWFALSVIVLAIVVAIYVWAQHRHARPAPVAHHPMTAAEKDYLKQIEVLNPKMSAASNFLGDTLYYLEGQLVNKGSHDVRELDLNLTFMDPFGQVVLRETEHPITLKTPPLKAGQTQPLHFTFEHLPAEWNEGPPQITPTYVSF